MSIDIFSGRRFCIRLVLVPTVLGDEPQAQQPTHVAKLLLSELPLRNPEDVSRVLLLFHGQDRGEDEVCHALRPPETAHEVLDQAAEPHPPQVPVLHADGRLHFRCHSWFFDHKLHGCISLLLALVEPHEHSHRK